MFFFLFFELYLAKYLQRGRGRARSTWCLTNREFPSMTMASVQWPLGKIQNLKLVFLDCIPGKITYIALQYHLQWTTYIFKGCEQFDKFFLHWLTYKRKKTWLTYFPISCFKLPPSSTTFGMIFHFSAIPAAFSTSRQPNITDSIVLTKYTSIQYILYIYITYVHIHIRYLVCNSPNHPSAPTSNLKNRGASGAPGQNPKMLATNPRIMKISKGAKIKLLREPRQELWVTKVER